jgi:hypothetical protein
MCRLSSSTFCLFLCRQVSWPECKRESTYSPMTNWRFAWLLWCFCCVCLNVFLQAKFEASASKQRLLDEERLLAVSVDALREMEGALLENASRFVTAI